MNFKVLLALAILISVTIACKNTTNEEAEPITPTDTRATMEYNENRLDTIPQNREFQGVFKGSGSEPFWSVKLDSTTIHFESANEELKSFKAPISSSEISGNTSVFKSSQDKALINVILNEENCTGAMNGKSMSHKVKVSIKLSDNNNIQTFEGCGSFLPN